MIYRHKPSGVLYRWMFDAFDVQTQRQLAIYISTTTGEVFARDRELFDLKFEFVTDIQAGIRPRGSKAPLEDQLEMALSKGELP